MSSQLHILIVEKSEIDALPIIRELQKNGLIFMSERVGTMEAMLAAIPRRHWDVVIANCVMPQFSGLTAIRVIREIGLDMSVVVVSDTGDEDTAVEAMRAGAADYVRKDNLARLVPAIERELREAKERRDRRRAEAALRRTESELDEAQRSLMQSEKLAALGRFSSGIAHEIKNPLGIVIGGIEFLEVSAKKADVEVRKVVAKIKDAALRAAQIVDEILKFAKPSSLELEMTDPNDVVKDTLSLFRYGVKSRNVKIGANYSVETMSVKIDRNRIQQVLFNLLANAVESLEHGGEVHLNVSRQPRSKAYPKGSCVIEVADTGIGIPPENMRHLFEPFFTTKREQKGTGLGLSVAKTIVDHHNGDLQLESEVGKGTKARIVLQLAEDG